MSVEDVRRRRPQEGESGSSDTRSIPERAEDFAQISTDQQPHAVPIVLEKEEHDFVLDVEALQQILLREDIRDKKVAVVSIAGAFRKGKSFLLDFFVRYLERGAEDGDLWIGGDLEPLKGFPWRGGSTRETTGILLWSKPFTVKLPPTGEEVVVLLMDTQGAFDNRSTVKDCATVFALSTMLASVQVYNLSQLIQENDLQHLQLFTEYGRLALESGSSGVFQSLCFLVRDWNYPYEHQYGVVGGLGYLDKTLQVSDDQHDELKQVRKHINNCFKSVTCFLMPYPGREVATSPNFEGQLKDIDAEFKESLKDLAPMFLAPENLVVKEINGTPITCRGLVECFKSYMKIFKGKDLPEPKGMLQATAEANNLAALAMALDQYNREMEDLVGGEKPYLAEDKFKEAHYKTYDAALELFRSTKKMGGELYSKQFEEKLQEQLKESFEHFEEQNASKNIFSAARTPAVLFSFIACFYILSGLFDMVGITVVSSMMTWGMGVAILLLILWSYVRFSGKYREAGQYIDSMVNTIWEQAVVPVYSLAWDKGLEQAAKYAVSSQKKNK
jgi:atlastin